MLKKKIGIASAILMLAVVLLIFSGATYAASPTSPMGAPQTVALNVQRMPADFLAAPASVSVMKTPPGLTKKPPAPAANKWAVVIGIADYKGSGSDLWHPDEDAAEMAAALIDNYGFAESNVKLLTNRKATAAAILSAMDWLVLNEDAASTVVFFYSGHGFRAPDSELWDGDVEADGFDEGIVSYDLYGLPDGLLKNRLSGLESSKVALLFGSCHSGGMFDDASDLQAENRVIASACKADQYGYDYLQLGNTLWGKYFVDEALLHQTADLNGDGVSIEEAHEYSVDPVTTLQPDSQPQLSDNYEGDFIP